MFSCGAICFFCKLCYSAEEHGKKIAVRHAYIKNERNDYFVDEICGFKRIG